MQPNSITSRPVVQKYGGSSLSTLEKVRTVARKVLETARGGRPVVVVVSAMGKTTSELIDRAHAVSSEPPQRELDVLLSSGERMSTALLAMAITEAGGSAISLTGPQSGVLTDDLHANASIVDVQPERVAEELAEGHVVVVAGFQGLSPSGEVTTLGRGGSDTTAVALAGALSAERCEIYSDVPGVYTADPRIVEEPIHVGQVDSRLMAEYALHGARVLHPECIDLARRYGVAIHALSTFGCDRHTRIRCEAGLRYSQPTSSVTPSVLGVTSRRSRVYLRGPGGEADLYDRVREVCAGEIILRQRSDSEEHLLVDVQDAPDPERFVALLEERLKGVAELVRSSASVSLVSRPQVTDTLTSRVLNALQRAGTSASSLYRRPHSVTCAVEAGRQDDAVRALHADLVESALTVQS